MNLEGRLKARISDVPSTSDLLRRAAVSVVLLTALIYSTMGLADGESSQIRALSVTTSSGGNVTTDAVNGTGLLQMPPTIAAGNLLIAFVCGNTDGIAGVFSTATGWTQITLNSDNDPTVDTASYWRSATGTEGSQQYFQGSPTWYKTSNKITYQVYQIGGSPGIAPEGSTSAIIATNNPDPPALNPSTWAAEPVMWIAAVCTGERTVCPCTLPSITAIPSGYTAIRPRDKWDDTGFQTSQVQGTYRNTKDESENPEPFILSGTARNFGMTIGIRVNAESAPEPGGPDSGGSAKWVLPPVSLRFARVICDPELFFKLQCRVELLANATGVSIAQSLWYVDNRYSAEGRDLGSARVHVAELSVFAFPIRIANVTVQLLLTNDQILLVQIPKSIDNSWILIPLGIAIAGILFGQLWKISKIRRGSSP